MDGRSTASRIQRNGARLARRAVELGGDDDLREAVMRLLAGNFDTVIALLDRAVFLNPTWPLPGFLAASWEASVRNRKRHHAFESACV